MEDSSNTSEVSLDDHDLEPASAAAITTTKILSKICFARFGEGLPTKGQELQSEMLLHLKRMPFKIITRQAINYWFVKSSVPSRNSALIFMRSYLDDDALFNHITKPGSLTTQNHSHHLDDANLLRNQKKVYTQLIKFLRAKIVLDGGSAVEREVITDINKAKYASVFTAGSGRVVIDVGTDHISTEHHTAPIVGVYRLYRMRFSPDPKNPIACEVMQIFKRGREVRFRHWYLHEGTDLSRFEGVVFTIGKSIWLLGTNRREEDRLRVLEFRVNSSVSTKNRNAMWGLMLTGNPIPSSHDPVACRIVLIREQTEVSDINKFVGVNVDNVQSPSISEHISNVINRMIDNHVTAFSLPLSTDPSLGRDGLPITDPILAVNQETLDNALSSIAAEFRRR